MKPQLIVFGEDWGGLPSSTQHIIKQMRSDYRVTWVNSLGLRRPRASLHDAKRIINKVGRLSKQLLGKPKASPATTATATINPTPTGHFNVVEPQYLPFPGNGIARKINRVLLYRLLKRNANPDSSGNRPVIWITLPNAVDALHYLDKTGLVDPVIIYYCCDDFSALAGVDHDDITRLESELAQQADMVVVTSNDLVNKFPGNKTTLIPHGVDTQLFNQPAERASDLPQGKPIAGFYGSIEAWIDLQLISDLAQQMPDWYFVLIGNAKVDVSILQNRDNIFLLGARPHASLPGYSQHWQVSLLPFVLNEQIMACNPLKLREYLAAGQAIVSVDFPEVRKYESYVEIADGAAGFAQAIRASQQQNTDAAHSRQQAVAAESWQAVSNKINGLIQAS